MPTVVVAALSARQLAQSARRAGWNVLALDLFGDVDTQASAQRWMPIGAADALRIDADRFLEALQAARTVPDCFGWIAGAGFEPQPKLLGEGARLLPLIGNDQAVVRHVRDPRQFFAALDGLGIPHPYTQFTPPADPTGWLVKDFASSGGWHVRRLDPLPRLRGRDGVGGNEEHDVAEDHARAAPSPALPRFAGEGETTAEDASNNDGRVRRADPLPRFAGEGEGGVYFQRDLPGRAISMLFLADGKRALPLAMNALRIRAIGARPYVYHGAIGPITDLPAHVQGALTRAVAALAETFRLRGLGSLDVLLDGDTLHVLELNPRPTATLALYDADIRAGLLRLHVDACRGSLPARAPPPIPAHARGEGTVFAPRRCRITPDDVARLAELGCSDIPQPQSDLPAGAPVCTVTAHGTSVASVHEQLAAREAAVLAMVQNRNEAPDHGE